MRSKKQTKIIQARKLRKDQTRAEEVLWWLLRNRMMLGYKFRRQYIFKGFILDFYCPQAKLGIELEGEIHQQRVEYDRARQKLVEDHGITMLRFTNEELFKMPEKVLQTIVNNLSLAFPALSS